nr:MAG TPA: Prex DNA polymerase [Caudoviricetes sp.]
MQNDDAFWEEYEAAKHSLKWEDFKETEIYKTASEARRGSSKWSRLALNAPTQGCGIIILKVAMTNFFHWVVENKYFKIIKICNLIHDEALIEYPNTMEFVADKLKYFMEEASSKYCHKLPIPAEAETGLFWIH